MSRFNTAAQGTKTTNLAGGQAYIQSAELELISILLTSFANDQFYRPANDSFKRLKELVKQCDKKFVAQAAVYARTQFGMRSISHVVASELARYLSGETWGKDFYTAVIHRPDDITEILAYHFANKQKESNAMRKGLAKAFDKFDQYTLAKYRSPNKKVSLVDAVNIVHPVPTEKNAEAITALVKGSLRSFNTWETELTAAGQAASTEEEKEGLKKAAWTRLIKERRIGYFALLRNLRNIIEQAPDVLTDACDLLADEKLISKSLVLPFRFTTAYEEIEKMSGGNKVRQVLVALNKAVDIAVRNVPRYEGDTLVVLDVSSSMSGKPSRIGSLFSAVLVKSNNADFMTFDGDARYANINPNDSTITLAKAMRFSGGSTNFHAIFQTANRKYDRIIILSDMQGWVGPHAPVGTFDEYKRRYNANPVVYSFDLNAYGTMQLPEEKVFAIAGFSDKIFEVMKLLETDKQALINAIKKVEFQAG